MRALVRHPLHVLLVVVGLGSVACATPVGSPKAGPVAGPADVYRVNPPDTLQISVLPEPEIKSTVTVRPDGMITVDLVGDLPAAGRTVEEIAADIEQKLARYKRDARVTVFLARAASTSITILGEVGAKTTFPLPRETRLIEAMGAVGGWSDFAASRRVRIIRTAGPTPQILKADLEAIIRGDLRTNYVLRGGDLIIVPRSVGASIGYAIREFLFPVQALFGLAAQGGSAALAVQTGGASLGAANAAGAILSGAQ